MNIAEEIVRIRLSKNYSQYEMAVELGISQQVYSNIENGRTKRVSPEIIQFVQQNIVPPTKKTVDLPPDQRENVTTFTDLSSLITANADLSKANKDLAQANLELTKLVGINLSDRKGTFVAVESTKAHILELLAKELSSGDKYHSPEEALAGLHRQLNEIESRG